MTFPNIVFFRMATAAAILFSGSHLSAIAQDKELDELFAPPVRPVPIAPVQELTDDSGTEETESSFNADQLFGWESAKGSRHDRRFELMQRHREKRELLQKLKDQAQTLADGWRPYRNKPPLTGPDGNSQDVNSAGTASNSGSDAATADESEAGSEAVTNNTEHTTEDPDIPVPIPSHDKDISSPTESSSAATDTSKGAVDSDIVSIQPGAVSGPIDRIALATSLYATGQYRECLTILKESDDAESDSEAKDWAGYLGASCYRQLGNLTEAESRYRNLLDKKHTAWIAAASLWWLDHLSDQQQLTAKIEEVKTTTAAWKAELDVLRKPQ